MASRSAEADTLWGMLNKLRGKMNPSEYQNYILPFMFYDMASFSVGQLMKDELVNEEKILQADGTARPITYQEAWLKEENGVAVYRADLIDLQLSHFGYVIEPQYMAENIIRNCCIEGATRYFAEYFERKSKLTVIHI